MPKKLVETTLGYPSPNDALRGRCLLRAYEDGGNASGVIILTELADNPGTSVTNAIEKVVPLAHQLVCEKTGIPLAHVQKFTILDHVSDRQGLAKVVKRRPDTFARVTFQDPQGRPLQPAWDFISAEEVNKLTGESFDELAPAQKGKPGYIRTPEDDEADAKKAEEEKNPG